MHKIESSQNPFVKHLVRLQNDASYRQEMQKALVEGEKTIQEILPYTASGTLFSQQLPEFNFPPAFRWIQISESVENKISETDSANKVFGEFPLPVPPVHLKVRRLLALDGVSDPGNLGTLMRTALGLGWDAVFFLPGCCDPFNGKAIRASKGAAFKLPFQKGDWEDLEKIIKANNLSPLAADLEGKRPACQKDDSIVLVLGNEGQGLSEKTRERCEKICLPMRGDMESLNVAAAGAILMYVLRHQ